MTSATAPLPVGCAAPDTTAVPAEQRGTAEQRSSAAAVRAAIDRFNSVEDDPNGTDAERAAAAGDAIAAFNDLDARLEPRLAELRAAFDEFDRLESDPRTDGNDASLSAASSALDAFRSVDLLLTGEAP